MNTDVIQMFLHFAQKIPSTYMIVKQIYKNIFSTVFFECKQRILQYHASFETHGLKGQKSKIV